MIEWLVQSARENPPIAAGVAPKGLLSAAEEDVYDGLYSVKRRKDWLLGRWTAKRLVQGFAAANGMPYLTWETITILAADDGAPEIWLGKGPERQRAHLRLAISHAGSSSLCALVGGEKYGLGADIETITRRPASFAEDYFTDAEIARVQCAPAERQDLLITLIWSAKESALKAVRQGLRLDTRVVSCLPLDDSVSEAAWHPMNIAWSEPGWCKEPPVMIGWCRLWQNDVLTLAVAAHVHNLSEN